MYYEHDRRSAFINLIIWSAAAVWVLVLLSFLPEQRSLFLLIVGGVLFFTIVVIGISPLFTPHELTGEGIVLRQGWHSRLVIPFDRVKGVQSLDRIEAKEGVLLDMFNRTLVMTDARKNGLRLELKETVRVPSMFWKKVDVVIFDVDDRDRFVAEVSKHL